MRPNALPFAALAAVVLVPSLASGQVARPGDLEELLDKASVVVRAQVVSLSGQATESSPLVLELKVLATLKGTAPSALKVPVQAERPLRPAVGERGYFFLAPSQAKPAQLACIQSAAERWAIEPGAEEPADEFLKGLSALREQEDAPPHTAFFIDGLRQPSLRLATFSAQRLSFWASRASPTIEQWERLASFLADETASDEVRAGVVAGLGESLSSERAMALQKRLRQDSLTRAALLKRMGEEAARRGPEADRARGTLSAAGSDSPEVALSAAEVLAGVGDEAALPVLERSIQADAVELRRRAALALADLGQRGSSSARAMLKRLEKDPDSIVRLRVEQGLSRVSLAARSRAERNKVPELLVLAAGGMLALGLMALRVGARKP